MIEFTKQELEWIKYIASIIIVEKTKQSVKPPDFMGEELKIINSIFEKIENDNE